MDNKEKNTRLGKGVIIAFAAMGAVIVGLVIALVIVCVGKSGREVPANTGAPHESVSSDIATSEPLPDSTPASADSTPASSDSAPSEQETAPAETESTPSSSSAEETLPPEPPEEPTAPAEPGNSGTSEVPAQTTPAATTSDKPVPEQPAEQTKGYTVSYSSDSSWESSGVSMYGAKFGITNNSASALSGWKLVLTIPNLASCEGWNGTYTASGDKLTITNAEYNGDIGVGGSLSVGCNLGVSGAFKVTAAELNGVKCTVVAGTVADNPGSGGSGSGGNSGQSGGGDNPADTPADVKKLLERSPDAVQGDDWLHTDGNKILDKDGKQVWLTGVNWFGYNTGTNTFDGLWNSELTSSVKAIADHGFNLIRVPISAQLINQWAAGEYPRANYNQAYNTALNGMNSLEIFDYFLKLAEENGMKVMPDIHSAETDASGHVVNLWYTSKVSVEQYYSALEWLAERYKDNDTIIAIDLKNEPHGKPSEGSAAAIWNNSTAANNWKYVAEQAAKRVLAKNPNVLIMVEGTEIYSKKNGSYTSTNDADYYFNWWGGNLRCVKDYPIDLGKYQNKLVYSPHDYGPTVFMQPWFKGGYTYDSLMNDCWRDNWLYIHTDNTAPLLIGEWGGYMTEPNITWMTYMRKLIKTYHLNHTFWCFNANSGDTGGLVLDDFKTWDEQKYAFVKEVLWQENGKFVGLDHAIPLGENGITTTQAKGLG